MGNRNIKKILRQLKAEDSEVRFVHPLGIYLGKIESIGKKDLIIKPYTVWENIPNGEKSYILRARLEETIGLPFPIRGLSPEKLSEGYLNLFIKSQNYQSWRSIKDDNLKEYLFKGFLLPTEEERKLFEKETPSYFRSNSMKENGKTNSK